MQNTIQDCAVFMRAASQAIPAVPTQPTPDILKLRLALELEELYEKSQAFGLGLTFRKMLVEKAGVSFDTDDDDAVIHLDYGPASSNKDTGIYNAVEVLDAACDQRVVADGTVLACGLQGIFEAGMTEVFRSNMSKFCASKDELEATVLGYDNAGVPVLVVPSQSGGFYPVVVKRASDGKVLKNVNYSPANLTQFFTEKNH